MYQNQKQIQNYYKDSNESYDLFKKSQEWVEKVIAQNKADIANIFKLPVYPVLYRKSVREQQRLSWTLQQKANAEKIEKEFNGKVKVVVDSDFVEWFSKLMGIHYRGVGLGDFVAVRSEKELEDETILRHEAIHCLQQRDMGLNLPMNIGPRLWMIPWLASSAVSMLYKKYFGKFSWLRESGDYGTDNQRTDLETYLYESDPNYASIRNAKTLWKLQFDPEFRKQEMKKLRKPQFEELLNKRQSEIEQTKYIISDFESKIQKGNYKQEEIEEMKEKVIQLKKYNIETENWIKMIQEESEFNVVLIEPDLPANKKAWLDQRWVQGTGNLKKRIAIEKFIQNHWNEEDNYSSGVEAYLKKK